MATKPERDAGLLYDLLVEGDQTYLTVAAALGWERTKLVKIVRVLRGILARNGDTITVTCDPDPYDPNGPWVYTLRGGGEVNDPEETVWIVNRFLDMLTRLQTLGDVEQVVINATDGRTNKGKKARIYAMHLRRAKEEVELTFGVQDTFDF